MTPLAKEVKEHGAVFLYSPFGTYTGTIVLFYIRLDVLCVHHTV
jgi:hypothetical protein